MRDEKEKVKYKHSNIGIISFVFCVFSLIPVVVNIFTGGLLTKLPSILKIEFLNFIFFGWVALFMLLALTLSIIDVRKPGRAKALPKIAMITSIAFFALFILVLATLYTTPGTPNI